MTLLMRDQENLQKGIEQGLKQGENRLAELTKRLMEENRYNDIKLVIEDTSYRQELYQKYHINT